METRLKAWTGGLVLLGLAVGGGLLVSPQAQSQPPAAEPGVKAGAPQPKGSSKDVQAAEQPSKFVVTSPLTADVVVTQAYVGKLVSQARISISPLVSGFLEEIPVKEGQAVKKGEVLFKILPTSYQAKLDIELAEVKIAQLELDGVNKLFQNKTVSPNEVALSQAKLAKAQARAKLAEMELNFTTVRAPFDGIIGRLQMQPGSLAKQGDALTTLTDNSVMRVYFNVPEVRYFEYMAGHAQGKEDPQIELVLAGGSKLPSIGNLAVIEAQTDTGSIVFRADFPNVDRLLLHGQSGNVLLHQAVNNALVIPPQSTFEINDRRYVYVVGKDGVVHRRQISIQHEMDDYMVIRKGLDPSDRILVEGTPDEGIRKVPEGKKVESEFRKPEEVMPNLKKHAEK